ncbi:glycogen debranching protein GlgX [Modicisalibacter xianhensis]|uniref:Glycogen operon protein n=1 Tax=Modicisalibacter xianhensis TaxID=442341 RepID=A0A1I2ZZB0_9GAMM|nr:glycogen debranching protein GlgX [Halomonas xianhensis]SFH43197.1 glycogen operon protein [Halomonas xianhensis]
MGAHFHGGGVNFALFSRHASRVHLELFELPEDAEPARVVSLDPGRNRTGDVWHVWVNDIRPGQLYAYRLDGPYQPEKGHRFNFHKLLLDPYARAMTLHSDWDYGPARGYDPSEGDLSPSKLDNAGSMPKCIVTDSSFDWQHDLPLRHSWSKTVIYEVHVRGFTRHPSAKTAHPGTYRGLMEKIPYLKELGVTALELLPVHEFNERQLPEIHPVTGQPFTAHNYWGYNSVGYFAPKASYSSAGSQRQQVLEFKALVRALHQAGIEVILDVVLNHTAEGNELGPTLNFRGIDNAIYYMLADDKRHYKNYAGTGNTFNANHPVVRNYILDVLRYWVVEMHVDGFRFDLASILGRGCDGKLLAHAPLPAQIAEDPVLRDVKLIAEAWDIAGAYELGNFSEQRWSEWNSRYRDDIRRFWRGDEGMLGAFASRICGSADIYAASGKEPDNSINYVTCHDGFTLNDLVSYSRKHNEANGEHNYDGTDDNYSANYGTEGETTDAIIEMMRERQIKNFLLTLFISRGVPMLLGGDEFRRTQQGNNNAYCQDNETSWYDWHRLETHAELFRFVQRLIAFRHAHPVLSRESFYTSEEILWLGPQGGPPEWHHPHAKQCACFIREEAEHALLLMFNAGMDAVDFHLPPVASGMQWRLVVDTGHEAQQVPLIVGADDMLEITSSYQLSMRSSAILIAK